MRYKGREIVMVETANNSFSGCIGEKSYDVCHELPKNCIAKGTSKEYIYKYKDEVKNEI